MPTSRYLYIAIASIFLYTFLESLRQGQVRILPESLLLIFWLIWTVTTGILFQTRPGAEYYSFASPVFRHPFFGILCLVMLNSFNLLKPERSVFAGFVFCGIALILLTLFSGELYQIIYIIGRRLGDETWNSNEYAYLLLFAVFAATYFSLKSVRPVAKYTFAGLIAILTVFIVLSASRKALLGEAAFFLLTLGPKYIRGLITKLKLTPAIIASIIIFAGASIYIMNNTFVGQRWTELLKEEAGRDMPFEARFAGRGFYYIEGIKLFSERPVLGVGLDNFRYHNVLGAAAHSDYVAVLTETGIPGFILYFAAYLVVLMRLQRAIAVSTSAGARLYCRILRNGLIVILLVALGRWNYDHMITYIFLALSGKYAAEASGVLPRSLV